MALENPLLISLFFAANNKKPTSDKRLVVIKSLITMIQEETAQGLPVSIDDHDPKNVGDTALIIAARRGHEGIVQLLLEAKANLNAENRYGNTALIEAVQKRHIKVVELLLNAGACIETSEKYTAIEAAVDLHLDTLDDIFNELDEICGHTGDILPIIHASLRHGAFTHHPERLLQFLTYCDGRDPIVLDTLYHLREHLNRGYESTSSSSSENIKTQVNDFIQQLNEAAVQQQEKLTKNAHDTIEKYLPPVLNNIIYQYCVPLDRLGFFTLPPLKVNEDPAFVESKPNKHCKTM